MALSKNLIIGLSILIVIIAAGLMYLSRISGPPGPTRSQPAAPEIHQNFAVLFLGNEIKLDYAKETKAAEILLAVTKRSPETYGNITLDLARDNIRRAAQITAISIANFSIIDLACESVVTIKTPCEVIDDTYNTSRSGFPDQRQLYPASDGYSCRNIRESFVKLGDKACSSPTSAQQAYTCSALQTKDCGSMYTRLIEDYTYTTLGISTGEPGFCSLAHDPRLKSGCLNNDKDTVSKDMQIGVEGP